MSVIDGENLWNSLPLPGFISDMTGQIIETNNAAELFFNMAARSLRGRGLHQVLGHDSALEKALQRAGRNRGPVYVSNFPLTAPAGEADLQIVTLAGSQDRLLVMVQPQRPAGYLGGTDQAKSAARSAIGMAEMLVHEVKNPLAGITGAAQLLAMIIGPEDRELCDLIVGESHRIVALLDQVEQFGNLSPPQRRVENIHDLLDQAKKSAEVGFAAHMKFSTDYDPSLPPTHVDGGQMLQVFSNLMRNAAEAAQAAQAAEKAGGKTGGMITLRSFYDHGLSARNQDGADSRLPLQIEIIDDGPGIAPDIARQIFEPFISGRENGTGLGLALVSKIISDHKSLISVDSMPGRTVFRISLPLATKKHGGEG